MSGTSFSMSSLGDLFGQYEDNKGKSLIEIYQASGRHISGDQMAAFEQLDQLFDQMGPFGDFLKMFIGMSFVEPDITPAVNSLANTMYDKMMESATGTQLQGAEGMRQHLAQALEAMQSAGMVSFSGNMNREQLLKDLEGAIEHMMEDGQVDREEFINAVDQTLAAAQGVNMLQFEKSNHLHHAQRVEAKVEPGQTATDPVVVKGPGGDDLFTFDDSIDIYTVVDVQGGAHLDQKADNLTPEEIREVLAGGFSVSLATDTIEVNGAEDTVAVGYYIESSQGSFYVGPDAIPEDSVSQSFMDARKVNMVDLDTANTVAPSVESAIGVDASQQAEVNALNDLNRGLGLSS